MSEKTADQTIDIPDTNMTLECAIEDVWQRCGYWCERFEKNLKELLDARAMRFEEEGNTRLAHRCRVAKENINISISDIATRIELDMRREADAE